MAIIYIAHIVLPLAAIAWLAFAPSLGMRVAQTIAVGVFLTGSWLAGFWFYPPNWALWVYAMLFAAAAWRAWRRPRAAASVLGLWSAGAVSLLMGGVGALAAQQGVAGRIGPSESFDLAAPLRGGRFCVISGGASPLLNFHFATLAPGFANWRGQSYGVDFVAVGSDGLRARSLAPQPTELGAYRIYGSTVHAPCAGEVIAARDGLPSQAIGTRDRVNLAGNHLTLRCSGGDVTLAHMRPGSLRVGLGDVAAAGDTLGLVGNSGNSDEPHLHIHAQRPPPPDAPPQSGEPLHVTFAGRFLARGDCL